MAISARKTYEKRNFSVFPPCPPFLLSFLNFLSYWTFEFPTGIDGGYTEWSEWSMCYAVDCDKLAGEQWQSRTCTNPKPEGNGSTCEEQGLGPAKRSKECEPGGCGTLPPKLLHLLTLSAAIFSSGVNSLFCDSISCLSNTMQKPISEFWFASVSKRVFVRNYSLWKCISPPPPIFMRINFIFIWKVSHED